MSTKSKPKPKGTAGTSTTNNGQQGSTESHKPASFFGKEYWYPIVFLVGATTIGITGIIAFNDKPMALLGLAFVVVLMISFGYASISIIRELWQFRKECWLEIQAKMEREELRKENQETPEQLEIKAERNHLIEKYQLELQLIEAMEKVKPAAPKTEESPPNPYKDFYDKVKEDLTAMLKEVHPNK